MRVAILQIEGTNCEEESYTAFKELGHEPEYVHLNLLKWGKKSLEDYDMLFIPGGFSAGDYIRAGAIFAARLKAIALKDIKKFVDEGKKIMGVCNGFQVLIELGLLPGTNGISEVPEAALMINDSNRFECRWTYLKKLQDGLFTSDVPEIISLPVAHGEGKFVTSERIMEEIIENGQIAFKYVKPDGSKATYPWNPNGSMEDIAALTNPEGNVLGMMPHPERAFFPYQHPDWMRFKRKRGDGYHIFSSLSKH
ncbi:phosphoribosylformylglycinamidine synthase I [Aciduliprofundum sp. MAR08-339]|uniref:phosphoribosylformylglycinamidine synthase subunit PurQ n=1 Tax=Aciduliprofundum sp. (strain MAR08-339) TaxID=673860 RepID=UPI0002A4ABAD|nr:phosphoribosylformylglycinamidine synthase I [Aciduliprofundum sp. MAR08-339]